MILHGNFDCFFVYQETYKKTFLFNIVSILEVTQNTIGQKLFLQENKVKNQSWNLVLISTDMGSIVSPRWDNDLTQNLVSS